MTDSAARATSSSIDISKRDLTLDIARVFCVVLVVVIHLLMVGVGNGPDGLVVSRPLENESWFWIGTWFGQIMPLFFVVGGFASFTAWRSLQRRGGTAADYVRNRVLRLAQPALPLFLFYVVVVGVATLIQIDPELLGTVVAGAGFPLWFLAAYTACQALVPLMARLHATRPRLTVVALLALVVLFDTLRFTIGITELGLPNMVFVWLLAQQIGFWYADGWFAARNGWQLAGITVASYAVLAAVSLPDGWYSNDMLANLNPPTLPLVCLALAQACILRALKPWLARLMNTHAARAVVFLVGTRLMTIYLWHLPIIIILSGIALLIPGASPEPASPAWWWTRPIFFVLVFAALFALSFLVARWEAPREVGITPPPLIVGLAAVLTFVPAFAVTQWFLDLPLAILGSVFFSVAILLLGRWRTAQAVAA
jgi:surface polysaccharide O-acyltransferase-like enzyme